MEKLHILRWNRKTVVKYFVQENRQKDQLEEYEIENENRQWAFEQRFLKKHLKNIPAILKSEISRKVYRLIDTGKYEFTIKRKLGEGAYGKIYEADQTVIKIQDCCGSYHDCFVGYFLNTLKLPNFQKTYGIFERENHYDIENFLECSDGDEYAYLVLEYIEGITFYNWLKNGHSDEEICLVFICIFAAFEAAYEKFKFTHYDLHSDNIIIKDLGTKQSFEYKVRGNRYEIMTQFLPVVIDYGFATINVKGRSVGIWSMQDIGVFPNYPRPLYDFMRLVNNCYEIRPIFQKWALQYCSDSLDPWSPILLKTMPQNNARIWDKIQYADIFLFLLSELFAIKQKENGAI